MSELASEQTVDYSNDRIEDMRSVFESEKEAMVNGLKGYVNSIIGVFAEDKNWSWIASANYSTLINSWKYHLDRCSQSLDKTLDKMRTLSEGEMISEISINDMDKLIFTKNAQLLNIERAEFCLDELKKYYPSVFGKEYQPASKGKLRKVESDPESQKFIKEQLKLALKK